MLLLLKLRSLVFVAAVLFALYSGWQALEIAGAGVVNQIPQLEGDGGGSMLFAVFVAAGGVASLLRPSVSVVLFGLALAAGVLTGIIYQDLMLWFWSAAAALLGAVSVVNAKGAKRRRSAGTQAVHRFEVQ